MTPTAAAPELPKQSIDYTEHPDGSITAKVTILFADGQKQEYVETVTQQELEAVAGEYVGAELAIIGPDGEVGFGFLKKIAKGISKAAKAVVTSKVFKVAATGLAIASPILGPLAPAALAASAGMGIAAKLAKAGAAAASGAKELAKQITASAHVDAKALTKTAAGAASLMQHANAKRTAAANVPTRKVVTKPTPKPQLRAAAPKVAPKAAPARPPAARPAAPAAPAARSEADLLARARAGRVRSNKPGNISDQQLLAAHRAGRIFWVV